MKRTVVLLLLFTVVLLSPAAETVMVAVNEGTPPAEEEPNARYYLSAAEAGAMDVLFDAGHIVFNAGTYTLDESEAREKRYEVRSMARSGGAGYALHIEVDFERPDKETIRPVTAHYMMMDISGARVVKSGSFPVEQDSERAPEELTFRAGQRIAENVLRVWTASR